MTNEYTYFIIVSGGIKMIENFIIVSGGIKMIENFIITYITDYNPYLMEEATAVFLVSEDTFKTFNSV